MVRPGHIQRSSHTQFQGNVLNEREQHVLRERLLDKASKEMPTDSLGGPLYRTILCFAMGGAFGAGVWRASGEEVAYEFYAAWLLELCLSMENLLAIYMVFRYFKVPSIYQEYVLWWGLIGAVILRGAMIFAGGVAILMLKELLLAYAAVVIYSGFRLLMMNDLGSTSVEDMSQYSLIRAVQHFIPVTDYYDGTKFLSYKTDGSLAATPLMIVLLAVELTDFMFAVDNVPALFGVAERGDVFIVFSATVFGLIGLRSAYTLLTMALPHMYYLQKATGGVLVFVGMRALADYFGINLPTGISLIGIIVVLAGSAAASIWSADWIHDAYGGIGNEGDVETSQNAELPVQMSSRPNDQGSSGTNPSFSAHAQQAYSAPPKGVPVVPKSQVASGPGKGRSVAADLIGSALGDVDGSVSSLAFKMTAQD